MDTIETQTRQAAKNEDVLEMKKTMFKPLQEKQDTMDDRLKRLEQGFAVEESSDVGARGRNRSGGMILILFWFIFQLHNIK